MLYVIIAILVFGVLIATHELGHFAAAKLLGVKVNEFSIGMGPALWQSRKETGETWEGTLYSVRALPIGGYCAMEGEDGDSDDPQAFGRARGWKKLIILAAGAGMNFLTGLLIVFCLNLSQSGFALPTVAGFLDGFELEGTGLQAGDVAVSVDGHRIYEYGDLALFLSRAGDRVDWVVERDGRRLELKDLYMPLREGVDEDGNTVYLRGLSIGRELLPATAGNVLRFTWYNTVDLVRLVWISLGDLITGAVGLRDLSGPVGIVEVMTEVGAQSAEVSPLLAVYQLSYLAAMIAVNLAIMNLLPLPALDGGRIFFLALNGLLYGVFRRRIPAQYESYVHLAGLAALMALMLMVTLSDVGKLFGR